MMIQHCSCGPGAKVWQPAHSPYCKTLHSYVPHKYNSQCRVCEDGGMYVPLINLVCFMQLSDVLMGMLRTHYIKEYSSAPSIYDGNNNKYKEAFRASSCDDVGFQAVHVSVVVDFGLGLKELLCRMDELELAYFKYNSPVILAVQNQSAEALKVLSSVLDRSYLERVYEVCMPLQMYVRQFFSPLQFACHISPLWLEGKTLWVEILITVL